MAYLDRSGTLDYELENFEPPPPRRYTRTNQYSDEIVPLGEEDAGASPPYVAEPVARDGPVAPPPPAPTAPPPSPYAPPPETPTRGGGSPSPEPTGVGTSIPFVGTGAPAPTPTPTTTGGGDGPDGLSAFLQQLIAGQSGYNSNVTKQRQTLLDKIGGLTDKYSRNVTRDDPEIAEQSNTYAGNMDRSLRKFQEKAAERAHAEGVTSGAFDAQLGNATMAGGRATGEFETGLMKEETMSRRDNLMKVLQNGGDLLNQQDQSDIQNRISTIDAGLRSRGLDIQSELGKGGLDVQNKKLINDFLLGGRGLDIQEFLGRGNLDLGQKDLDLRKILGMGNLSLGGSANANQKLGIDNQNQQFYDKFAWEQGKEGNDMDSLLMQLLLK